MVVVLMHVLHMSAVFIHIFATSVALQKKKKRMTTNVLYFVLRLVLICKIKSLK